MPSAYQIDKQDSAYFLTCTVVEWVDLFIRDTHKLVIADNLNYCVENLGLEIFAYVIMPSHLHMIVSAKNDDLSKIIGGFKMFTSRQLIKMIQSNQESRRNWMLPIFKNAGQKNPRNKDYQLWQQNNHAEEVYSPKFTLSKINYIHNNPVEEGFVERPEDYLYSSARDYSGLKSPVKVSMIELHLLF